MQGRKYTYRDEPEVLSWFKARNINLDETYLPKTGFIVPGVAAGFLMRTDTKSGILEPFIANPEASGIDRNSALNLIMGQLVNEARNLGYTRVFGFATHRGMVSRALDQGFVIVEENSTTVCKDL